MKKWIVTVAMTLMLAFCFIAAAYAGQLFIQTPTDIQSGNTVLLELLSASPHTHGTGTDAITFEKQLIPLKISETCLLMAAVAIFRRR